MQVILLPEQGVYIGIVALSRQQELPVLRRDHPAGDGNGRGLRCLAAGLRFPGGRAAGDGSAASRGTAGRQDAQA